ncbi:MAG: M23 family metallopeptidase [Candidatus Daviesbacteria bacterium]
MNLWHSEKLLPKKLNERVALNHLVSQHSLKFRGVLKKLTKVSRFKHFPKLSLVGVLVFYFMGYQPTLAIPPFKQSIARAEFVQQQEIELGKFPHPFILPHPGYLSTRYFSWHPGIDIATGLGMPIHPVTPGKVTEASFGFWGLGHFVVIEHELGFKSIYGHMGRIFVKVGDKVTSSSILGEVGMTGHTSGPHTHLEMMKNGEYFDPQTILPSLSDWPKQYSVVKTVGQNFEPKPTVTSAPLKVGFVTLEKAGEEKPKEDTKKLPLLQLSQLGQS